MEERGRVYHRREQRVREREDKNEKKMVFWEL
jgi:hypothetical protein